MALESLSKPKVEVDAGNVAHSTLPTSLTDDYRNRLGDLIKLSEEQKKRLKAWLKKRIHEWREDTQDLHRRLLEDNDLVEGVIMETDYPWVGSSNVHMPVTEMYMEVYQSVEDRSILGADLIWYGETELDELKDVLPDIEEMLNYQSRHNWNIHDCISNVFWTTNRDGLGIIEITWSEEYEKANDIVIITNETEFLNEFPSPEDAGLDEDKYHELLEMAQGASEEDPLEIPITFEKQKYYGNKGEVVELINFVTIPAWTPDIDHESCRGYGKRYWTRGGVIRDKMKQGFYYEDACKKILKGKGKSDSLTQYTQAQDDIEGIGRTNVNDNYELFALAVKGRLDGEDGDEQKYSVIYSDEQDELLQCIHFPYRIDNYAIFRISERPNRLIGRSIPQRCRDINEEIDTQHNQRINARTISTVPSFKMQKTAAKDFDPDAEENRWRPGVIFKLTNFEAFEQFKVQPTDLGESLSEENNDMKILDLILGSSVSLLSGGASPQDPNAPGNKTAMMIQQSNLRMDAPLSKLRKGVSKVGDICLSHLYQFGPPIINFQSEVAAQGGRVGSQTKTIHKKYLRSGIRMNMAGITVSGNPEAEMMKRMQLHQTLLQVEPLYAQMPELRVEGLRDALRAGRIPGRNRMLPDMKQIEQIQIETQKKAMMQMQMEQQAAQAQQAQEALKQRIQSAKQDLEIKRVAEATTKANMGLDGGNPAVENAL